MQSKKSIHIVQNIEDSLRKNNDFEFIPFIKERNHQGKLIK